MLATGNGDDTNSLRSFSSGQSRCVVGSSTVGSHSSLPVLARSSMEGIGSSAAAGVVGLSMSRPTLGSRDSDGLSGGQRNQVVPQFFASAAGPTESSALHVSWGPNDHSTANDTNRLEERLAVLVADEVRQLAARLETGRTEQVAVVAEMRKDLSVRRELQAELGEQRHELAAVRESLTGRETDPREQSSLQGQLDALVGEREELHASVDSLRAIVGQDNTVVARVDARMDVGKRRNLLSASTLAATPRIDSELAQILARLGALESSWQDALGSVLEQKTAMSDERATLAARLDIAEQQLAATPPPAATLARLEAAERQLAAAPAPAALLARLGAVEQHQKENKLGSELGSMLSRVDLVETSCRDSVAQAMKRTEGLALKSSRLEVRIEEIKHQQANTNSLIQSNREAIGGDVYSLRVALQETRSELSHLSNSVASIQAEMEGASKERVARTEQCVIERLAAEKEELQKSAEARSNQLVSTVATLLERANISPEVSTASTVATTTDMHTELHGSLTRCVGQMDTELRTQMARHMAELSKTLQGTLTAHVDDSIGTLAAEVKCLERTVSELGGSSEAAGSSGLQLTQRVASVEEETRKLTQHIEAVQQETQRTSHFVTAFATSVMQERSVIFEEMNAGKIGASVKLTGKPGEIPSDPSVVDATGSSVEQQSSAPGHRDCEGQGASVSTLASGSQRDVATTTPKYPWPQSGGSASLPQGLGASTAVGAIDGPWSREGSTSLPQGLGCASAVSSAAGEVPPTRLTVSSPGLKVRLEGLVQAVNRTLAEHQHPTSSSRGASTTTTAGSGGGGGGSGGGGGGSSAGPSAIGGGGRGRACGGSGGADSHPSSRAGSTNLFWDPRAQLRTNSHSQESVPISRECVQHGMSKPRGTSPQKTHGAGNEHVGLGNDPRPDTLQWQQRSAVPSPRPPHRLATAGARSSSPPVQATTQVERTSLRKGVRFTASGPDLQQQRRFPQPGFDRSYT